MVWLEELEDLYHLEMISCWVILVETHVVLLSKLKRKDRIKKKNKNIISMYILLHNSRKKWVVSSSQDHINRP